MTVTFIGDFAADLGAVGMTDDTATTAAFDSAYTNQCVSAVNAVANGANSPNVSLGISIAAVPVTSFWLHFVFYKLNYDSLPGGTYSTYLSFKTAGGVEVARIEGNQTVANQLRAVAVGDTTVTSAYTTSFPSGKATFDVRVTAGSTITINVYVGGALVAAASAANTTGAKPLPVSATWSHANIWKATSASNVLAYSEVCATDGESTIGWRIASLRPTGAGTYSTWVGGYSQLGDTDFATGAGSLAAAQRVSSTLSAYGGPASPTSIRGVFAKARGSRASTGPQHIVQSLRLSSADYDGSTSFLPDNATQMIQEWALNPATGTAWTTSALTGMELGLLSAA